jgi:ATP adenylyltransferase
MAKKLVRRNRAKKTKVAAKSATKTPSFGLHDRWPQERDFMERPDRWRYVRKIVPHAGCVFCEAAKAGPQKESLCLWVDEHVMVVLNKYPYNTGHMMVLPTRHCGDLLELSDVEYMALSKAVRKVMSILKKEYEPTGFNVGMNHGAVAGAGIPDHLHWHVVPRWFGDTNFFPLIAETKVLPETLEQTYQRLRGYF